MKKLLIVVSMTFFVPSLWAECKEFNADRYRELVKDKRHLVFFASWCKSCADHFTEAYAKDSIFVTSYDDGPTADKIVTKYLGEKAIGVPCIVDKDQHLVRQFGVKVLPFVAKISESEK